MKKLKRNKATETRRWFGCWSNEYDRTLGSISFHRELLDLVVKNTRVKSGDKILDLGCGTGLLSLRYLQKSCCSITGVDYSREMIDILKDKVKKLKLKDRISICLLDAASLKFKDNTFDRVVSSVALHHVEDKLPVLKKVFRVLKPGGIFIIGEVDMDTTGKHTDAKRLKRILRVLEQEWIPALKDVGVGAFSKMFDNGKKHILNQGEYCLSLKQWASLCRRAGFSSAVVKRVPRHKAFGIVVAKKA
ncbi:MAG: methyltransferase domain-containing protein [Candidatus Margulisiibacteriota bacterium]